MLIHRAVFQDLNNKATSAFKLQLYEQRFRIRGPFFQDEKSQNLSKKRDDTFGLGP